ncbi:hypothetical protein KDW54_07085 [Burkholderia ambifaria]|uniref:hypothetical protein n=1 Tax=Burkholderia ambifaria TaxID=152480 RepID=UPI001B98B04F|nr:hypothetical protein [Burkholderia ambifaria]MBR8182158.1 hypothetical protein [Burkholderia ambifaria]
MTEREEFEAFALHRKMSIIKISCGRYKSSYTQAMWESWQAARRTTPDREAIIDLILAKLDPMIRSGAIDEPYHSERNGLIMAWNVVASLKTAPNGEKG